MQFALAAITAFAALAFASPAPQGVTQNIAPTVAAPPGCVTSYPKGFSITTINATTSHKHKVGSTCHCCKIGPFADMRAISAK